MVFAGKALVTLIDASPNPKVSLVLGLKARVVGEEYPR
jgi:hypothetical protein